MKKFLSLALLIFCYSYSLLAQRRGNVEEESDLVIEINPVVVREKAEYHPEQASQSLHRQALKAFQLGDYEDARSCFSLAVKSGPKSDDIKLDYLLFSMVVPWMDGQSLSRAEGLFKQLDSPRALKDPRYTMAQALLKWLQNDRAGALKILDSFPTDHPYFSPLAGKLKLHLQSGGELVNDFWAKKLLRPLATPQEKRKQR